MAIGGLLAFLLLVSLGFSFFSFPLWPTFGVLLGIAFVVAAIWYAIAHVQYAIGLPGYSFWQTLHFTSWKMESPVYSIGWRHARARAVADSAAADFYFAIIRSATGRTCCVVR